MISRLSPRAISAGVFACFCLLAASDSASAAPQTGGEILSGDVYPADCAATFNNLRAAIRYAGPNAGTTPSEVIEIWQLTGAGVPGLPVQTYGAANGLIAGNQTGLGSSGYQPSDRIELTNVNGASIGSGDSGVIPGNGDDKTYVDIFTVVAPFSVVHHTISPLSVASWATTHAGLANDVAITRDGAFAVVNSDNWIHVFNMGTGANVAAFNIGDKDYSTGPNPPSGWNRPCSPNKAVDSVAVTNDRAIVTTARLNAAGYLTTWVYIIDLGTLTVALQYEIVTGLSGGGDGQSDDRPHDVATAGKTEDMAVVTTTHAVALFDLVADQVLGQPAVDASWSRKYQKQVDSVEASDFDAVVIQDWKSPAGLTFWDCDVFRISRTTAPFFQKLAGYRDLNSTTTYPPPPESHAHDLALDKEYDRAVVRTSVENVIIAPLIIPPTVATIIASPGGSDAYAYEAFGTLPNQAVFSSDSVVISTLPNGNLMAATIGGRPNALTGVYEGCVDLIQLTPGPVSLVQFTITSNGAPFFNLGCVPLDLAISLDHTEVIVKSADAWGDSPASPGADIVRVNLASSTAGPSFGGSLATVMGQDSIAAPASGFVSTLKRIVTIYEDAWSAVTHGYVHIAH